MFVKAPQGKRCPFPDGQVVTEKPLEVADSLFLRRRLNDGSVMLTTKTQSLEEPLNVGKVVTEKNNKQSKDGEQ